MATEVSQCAGNYTGRSLNAARLSWPHNGEVPAVQGGDLRDSEPLCQSYDRRVRTAEREVPIALDQLGNSGQILPKNRHEGKPAIRSELTQEPGLDHASAPTLKEITDLGQHSVRDKQRLMNRLDPLDATLMIGVAGVD